MHQALYRKYRPETFSDVVGQDHITSVLKYEVAGSRTSHAYLFCGSRGTGKTTCAKILAKAVNCLSPVNGDPCGKCENCQALEKGLTTDVLEMDAASNTGVDYIRDIRDAVMYAPSMLKSRVYIIDEVHMLSDGAFNALLKTLEEPPSNVVFILATTEMQKIPATILSRCQRFEFRRIAGSVIAGRLAYIASKENIELTDDAAFLIARAAQGGMRDAISLLELCSADGGRVDAARVGELSGGTGRKTVEKTVDAILSRDGAELFGIVASLYASSGDLSVFWQELISYYRDMLVCKTVKGMGREELRKDILDLTESEFESLSAHTEKFRYETLLYHSKILDDALASTSGRNGTSGRIGAEIALLRMSVSTPDDSPAALLARIAALEERVACGLPAAPAAPKTPETPKTDETPLPVPFESAAAEEKRSGPPAQKRSEEKPKELKSFVDVLHTYMKSEPSIASFLTDSKAYLYGDGSIRVTVENDFALQMLEMNGAAEALRRIVRQSEGIDADILLVVRPSAAKDSNPMDELN